MLNSKAPPLFLVKKVVFVPKSGITVSRAGDGGTPSLSLAQPSTLKRLRALAKALERNPSAVLTDGPRIRAGTRLIREWRGEKHEVMVDGSGYEYRGKKFASLSEIARHITGTRWSGPLFFGLKTGKDRTAR